MRGIKFRAWEKNLKEMIPVDNIDFVNKMINTKSAWRLFDEVDLMQFTGLKDKNGKEICEGDICKNLFGVKGEVVLDNGSFKLKNEQGLYKIGKLPDIVGNIYEQPELLGDAK